MSENASRTSRRCTWWIGNTISLLWLAIICKFFGKYPLAVALACFLSVAALAVFWRILIRVAQTRDRRPWAHTTRDILEAAERRQKSSDQSA
jgi:hypothetical protein